ncbi:hypothetical protein BKA66DRAFT_475755 [Pyrenochaeta sp. MPI-SDFR-AT-0127]|nr:hypothetical protein BKA66DRAFT_475755 [Pyrenochaeta sp. MPI-SDFR-AT-0127]
MKEAPLIEEKRPTCVSILYAWICQWLTLTLIVSLLLNALLCSISHYIFLQNLDGRMTQNRRIQQPHSTTISVFLTVVFKACTVGNVGLSFTL